MNSKRFLVVGGNSGIGLAMVLHLLDLGFEQVYIVGKQLPDLNDIPERFITRFKEKTTFYRVDLTAEDYSVFDAITDIDGVFISIGFGRVAPFEDLLECEIKNLVKCNELAVIQILHKYFGQIQSRQDFYAGVMVSIAGHVASPLFSVYGAAKAGLKMFIENINFELQANGRNNRILACSPGAIKGTAFNGEKNNMAQVQKLVTEIFLRMQHREILYIPQYEEIFKKVIQDYQSNPEEYGLHSFNYKAKTGRIQASPQVVIGYLSGTFDLFHIGHLNLLRRAKEHCDYLIVGVHESGAWKGKQTFISFEDRLAIVSHIKYVDMAIKSYPEDADAWQKYHYHKLFVGSDYKGTERFRHYEEFFADKGVEIIYFPYTKQISSTQLREAIGKSINQTLAPL